MLILHFCCFSVPGTFLFIPYLCIFRSVCWPQNFQTRKFPYVITPKKCRWSSEKFLEDLPINKYKGYLSSDYQALTCVICMSIPIGPKTLEKESISLLHKPAKSTAALALFPIDISTDTQTQTWYTSYQLLPAFPHMEVLSGINLGKKGVADDQSPS